MAQDSHKKRVLVTGATGFVGSNLVKRLLAQGHEVLGIPGIKQEQDIPSQVRLISSSEVARAGKLDVLYHEAAITDTLNCHEKEMIDVNVRWPIKLFNTVIEEGCRRIVYASSTGIYGNKKAPFIEGVTPLKPLNVYGESKKALEEAATTIARHSGATIVGLRYCNIYGPGEEHKGKLKIKLHDGETFEMASMIYQLAQQKKTGISRLFKFGEQKRDFIYIDDVVELTMRAAQAKESCVVNGGSGRATTFNEINRILNRILGTRIKPEYFNMPESIKKGYQSHTECDMKLAKEKLDFEPKFDIEAGIKKYFESGALTKIN